MGSANRESIPVISQTPVASQIVLGKVHRLASVKVQQLLHVENLNTVVDGLTTNDGIVPHHANLAPAGSDRVERRQAAQIDQLSFAADLCKGGTVELADCYKLASIL